MRDKALFLCELTNSCYFGKMVYGYSDDWVFDTNELGRIIRVGKVGEDRFNMVGVSWFRSSDARILGQIVKDAYNQGSYKDLFWDDVVNKNLDKLNLVVHEISCNQISELDTVEELAAIDDSYKI